MTEAKSAALTAAQGSSQPAALRMSVSKIKQFYSTELEKSLSEYSIKPDAEQINCVMSLLSEMSATRKALRSRTSIKQTS